MDPYPRGSDWMPITPKTGSLFHADSHVPQIGSQLGGESRPTVVSVKLLCVDLTETVEGIPRRTRSDLLPRHVQFNMAVKPID